MKIRTTLFALVMTFSLALVSCGDDEDEEECVQDAICDISYTTCCTNDDCTFEYDGTEYTDENALAAAIQENCSTAIDDILASISSSTARAQANLF